MSFKLSDSFKENVKNKDNDSILSVFAVLINTDRGFEKGKADAAIEYLKEHYPQFIKPNRNEQFKEESEWTEDYWTEISASLYQYFSLEKIEFLRKMSKKLYPISENINRYEEIKPKRNSRYEFEEDLENNKEGEEYRKKPNTALAIAIITGAVITLAGIIAALNK